MKSRENRKKEKNQRKSDSSENEEVWEASDDSLDDIYPFLPTSDSDNSEVEADNFFEVCSPKMGDFVFVEFSRKKGTTYFVGQVTESSPTASEVLVNFLRKKEANFHFPQIKDEGLVPIENVKKVMPVPEVRRGHYKFKIKLPNVCIG